MSPKCTKLSEESHRILSEIAEGQLDDLWDEAPTYGTWIREDDLPEVGDYGGKDDCSFFKGRVSEERFQELMDGSEPTEAEWKNYQRHWIDEALSDCPDHDQIAGVALSPVSDETGQHRGVVLVGRTGYSFSGISTWLEGIFVSEEEAEAYMNADGWFGRC